MYDTCTPVTLLKLSGNEELTASDEGSGSLASRKEF